MGRGECGGEDWSTGTLRTVQTAGHTASGTPCRGWSVVSDGTSEEGARERERGRGRGGGGEGGGKRGGGGAGESEE